MCLAREEGSVKSLKQPGHGGIAGGRWWMRGEVRCAIGGRSLSGVSIWKIEFGRLVSCRSRSSLSFSPRCFSSSSLLSYSSYTPLIHSLHTLPPPSSLDGAETQGHHRQRDRARQTTARPNAGSTGSRGSTRKQCGGNGWASRCVLSSFRRVSSHAYQGPQAKHYSLPGRNRGTRTPSSTSRWTSTTTSQISRPWPSPSPERRKHLLPQRKQLLPRRKHPPPQRNLPLHQRSHLRPRRNRALPRNSKSSNPAVRSFFMASLCSLTIQSLQRRPLRHFIRTMKTRLFRQAMRKCLARAKAKAEVSPTSKVLIYSH